MAEGLAIDLTNITVKQLKTHTAQIIEGYDKKKNKYYVKLMNIDYSEEIGFSQCLAFNEEIFSDLEECTFKNHLLHIKTEISNQTSIGLVTQPFEIRLDNYIFKQTIDQKQVMNIFQQIVKAVYSIWMNGYWSRNIRAQHFVKVGKIWKLQCCVLNEDYSKSNGVNCEYLWSGKYQAPEFVNGKQYSDDQYNQMAVWNLGSILLNLIVGAHKLSNKSISDKWKGQQFSFTALGINNQKIRKYDERIKALLGSLLHHNPKKRMKINQLFQNKFVSSQVSKHSLENQSVLPPSKISIGKSVRSSKLDFASKNILNDISKIREQRERQERQNILTSKIGNSIVDDDEFALQLGQISNSIPMKGPIRPLNQVREEPQQLQSLESLLTNRNQNVRKSIELYKSYYDQSQLLLIAIQKIESLDFPMFSEEYQIKEIRMLVKYAVTFVSLINLNTLTEGFNGHKNILDLDADQFTSFQNSQEYETFKRLTNVKRSQRIDQIKKLKDQITFFKKKNLATKQDQIFDFLQRDFKKTNFQDIKIAYRLILKYAYDSISELYNKQKRTPRGGQLAQRAMFVTFCLTVDKLYIKEHIPDNFKYYFEWKEKASSNYVPLNDFLEYILKAPKETLIEHSRYILKKFYNI